jgi:hypothetical protein
MVCFVTREMSKYQFLLGRCDALSVLSRHFTTKTPHKDIVCVFDTDMSEQVTNVAGSIDSRVFTLVLETGLIIPILITRD